MINVDNGRAWRLDFLDAFVFPELLILSERMVFVDKYIPREKLGKKARRKLDAERRGTWGVISPVTRKAKNEKAYNRKKAHRGMDLYPGGLFCFAPLLLNCGEGGA